MKATTTCSDCDTKYTITSATLESVQYCPFCGAAESLPYEDTAEEDDNEPAEDDEF